MIFLTSLFFYVVYAAFASVESTGIFHLLLAHLIMKMPTRIIIMLQKYAPIPLIDICLYPFQKFLF